jgi:predicted RNase H-like nuclease
MTTLLVGFDSAWTQTNSGAIVGVLRQGDGTFQEFGPPECVNYAVGQETILGWQDEAKPDATIVLLDQPTIVENGKGQRPVENIVGSAVSLRYGGMQPANTGRTDMFGSEAPVWPFLSHFGGPADPLISSADTRVIETYPVLAMVALRWMLDDIRPKGRLPKYNPDRRRNFSISDWKHVCSLTAIEFRERGIFGIADWLDLATGNLSPKKCDQDGVDACICLLVALYLAERKDCLLVGDQLTGYIVVPYESELAAELETRCIATGRIPSQWVRIFQMS